MLVRGQESHKIKDSTEVLPVLLIKLCEKSDQKLITQNLDTLNMKLTNNVIKNVLYFQIIYPWITLRDQNYF